MAYVLNDSIKLDFLSRAKITNPKIVKSKRESDNLYFNVIKIKKLEDVDERFITWLKDSYLIKS